MITDDDMILLLLTIKNDGDSCFIEKTLGYYETAFLLKNAEKKSFIVEGQNGYKLTKEGNDYIKTKNNEFGRKGISKNIAPFPMGKLHDVSLNIYIPKEK